MTPFSDYVRALGRGPGRARHLTRDEARDAMLRILAGKEAAEAVGALLMLMRYRGESGEEVAGFVDALRERAAPWRGIGAGLDWPSYAAGRSRGAPWFLFSAILVARTGTPVLLHGFNSNLSHPLLTDVAVRLLRLPVVTTPMAAEAALATQGIAYAPLAAIDKAALGVLKLRDVLGLRSPINTCLKAFNPAGAPASVQGVFHPSYRALQQEAAGLLGLERLVAIKGGGGEAERNPNKPVDLFRLSAGQSFEETAPPLTKAAPRRHADTPVEEGHFLGVWSGGVEDAHATETIIGTAALALLAADPGLDLETAQIKARQMWRLR